MRLRQALLFWGLGIVGTFAGARLATVLPEKVVLAGFAVVMLGAAVAMWRKSSAVEPSAERRTAPWLLPVVAVAIGLLLATGSLAGAEYLDIGAGS